MNDNTERINILMKKYDTHVEAFQYDDARECLAMIDTLRYHDEYVKSIVGDK